MVIRGQGPQRASTRPHLATPKHRWLHSPARWEETDLTFLLRLCNPRFGTEELGHHGVRVCLTSEAPAPQFEHTSE
jgi:hypothetical protein